MKYYAYKLNKQGDNIQPWHTPFPIWNQSVVPCPVLTVASWPAYRFLKRQVRWYGIPISLRTFQSLLWSTQSLWHSQQSRSRCFSGTLLLFQRSNGFQKTASFTPGPPCCPSSSFASALHQACPDGYFLAVLGRASHHDADAEKWIELFYVYKNNYIPQNVSDYLFIVWS